MKSARRSTAAQKPFRTERLGGRLWHVLDGAGRDVAVVQSEADAVYICESCNARRLPIQDNSGYEKFKAATLGESEPTHEQRKIRAKALEVLQRAIYKLMDARETASLGEKGGGAGFESETWGMLTRLVISEVGEELEQSLCNLGLIDEDCGIFVDELVREGT